MEDAQQEAELKDSQETIEAHIPNPKCITIAYPFCDVPKRSIFEQYYIAGRICSGSIVPSSPRDFMNISSIICGEERNFNNVSNFISRAESAVKSNGWCVYLLHGIDDDGGWSTVLSDTLRETLSYFKAHSDSFWVETFGNVVRYIKERDALSVSELSVQDDQIQIQVTDTLDNVIFNVPVTLRRPLPVAWASATGTQNGQPVEVKVINVNSGKFIQFDAVPDGGKVVLQKASISGIHDCHGFLDTAPVLLQHYPNPFNPTTTIHYQLNTPSHVRLSVCNLLGQEVCVLVNEDRAPGIYNTMFNGAGLACGIYFSNIRTESENGQKYAATKKLILSK
ncbi:T9SS type A sorting domain-containing protein [bacterium]|nr:T9SS type A sorting domain-containing protein [bacterium]